MRPTRSPKRDRVTLPFVIAQDKLASYLLNVSHRRGGSKARFFLSHGFRADDLAPMADALVSHAAAHWPGLIVPSAWGERHLVTGLMPFPDGERRNVLAVWEIRTGATSASFVTAYPK